MLSHDLARALLARRNHDLRFVAEVCLPGNDEEGDICRMQLMDDRMRAIAPNEEPLSAEQIMRYDPEDDMLDIQLGPIFAGRQGQYTLSVEEVQTAHNAVEFWLVGHREFGAERCERFRNLLNKIEEVTN